MTSLALKPEKFHSFIFLQKNLEMVGHSLKSKIYTPFLRSYKHMVEREKELRGYNEQVTT